jgi:hypothetical protein
MDRSWLSKRVPCSRRRSVETGGKRGLVDGWDVLEVVSVSIHGYYSFAGLVICEGD